MQNGYHSRLPPPLEDVYIYYTDSLNNKQNLIPKNLTVEQSKIQGEHPFGMQRKFNHMSLFLWAT